MFTGINCCCAMLSFHPGGERGVVQADRDFALLYGKGQRSMAPFGVRRQWHERTSLNL
jgi:hypothetical protein